MCEKRTSVSHSSTESDITSLDVGLGRDGIPALDLWDVVTEVLHSSNHKKPSTQEASGNRSGFKEAATCLTSRRKRKVTRMLNSCQIQIT